MRIYGVLIAALWGCTTPQAAPEVTAEVTAAENREAFTKYVIERMSDACETGKPVEITDGYWLVCRKGGKL